MNVSSAPHNIISTPAIALDPRPGGAAAGTAPANLPVTMITTGRSPRKYTEAEIEAAKAQALRKMEAREKVIKEQKEFIAKAVADHDLKFVYCREKRHKDHEILLRNTGGMTFAYTSSRILGGTVLLVSSAVCSRQDAFDKHLGRYYAAKAFCDGQAIKMKVQSARQAGFKLKLMGEGMLNKIFDAYVSFDV
jgi:hypothetical protein